MSLEEALINLGSEPLIKSKQGKLIRTYLNSILDTQGDEVINLSTPGDVILNRVYRIADMTKQSTVLTKEFGNSSTDENKTNYPTVLLSCIAAIVVVFVIAVIMELSSEKPLTQDFVNLMMHIVDGIFGIIQQQSATVAPPASPM